MGAFSLDSKCLASPPVMITVKVGLSFLKLSIKKTFALIENEGPVFHKALKAETVINLKTKD